MLTMTEMHFVRFLGKTHPKTNQVLDGIYYAVPGGGITTGEAARLWGLENKVKVTFSNGGWSASK